MKMEDKSQILTPIEDLGVQDLQHHDHSTQNRQMTTVIVVWVN